MASREETADAIAQVGNSAANASRNATEITERAAKQAGSVGRAAREALYGK